MLSYSPDAVTESMEAMRKLLFRPAWRESSWAPHFRERLAARLDDTNRHLRYLAIAALPVIHDDPTVRCSILAGRIAAEEDVDLLAMNLRMLDHAVPLELADTVLAAASRERSGGPSVPELLNADDELDLHELRNVWVTAHLNCHLHAATPHASAIVAEWFRNPASHADLFQAAVSSIRGLVSFASEEPLRGQAFELVRTAAAALERDLVRVPNDASVVLAADALIQELYFASGAFAGNDDRPRPTLAERVAWLSDGISVLEDLTAVVHPHSCYQLLETLEFFIDDDPVRIFRAVAATVKADSMFRFESMGVNVTVRIVERYLADHRQLFVGEPDLLSELRRILEVFARVGWPSALHLSYALGDVFR